MENERCVSSQQQDKTDTHQHRGYFGDPGVVTGKFTEFGQRKKGRCDKNNDGK